MDIRGERVALESISRFIRVNRIGFQESLRKVKHKAGSPSHKLVLHLGRTEIKTVRNYIKLKNDPTLVFSTAVKGLTLS